MIALLLALAIQLAQPKNLPIISPIGEAIAGRDLVVASREFSLAKRYDDTFVNRVFRENILLTLAYMRKAVPVEANVDWGKVDEPFQWALTLKPGETISFHDFLLPKYKNAIPLTTLHFNGAEGFLSDGWLTGDGVCHLASLIYWAAKDAGLMVEAPTNHDFAKINEVPKVYGVAIYTQPAAPGSSALQNLYIENNKGKNVHIVFDYKGDNLKVSVVEAVGGLASLGGLLDQP